MGYLFSKKGSLFLKFNCRTFVFPLATDTGADETRDVSGRVVVVIVITWKIYCSKKKVKKKIVSSSCHDSWDFLVTISFNKSLTEIGKHFEEVIFNPPHPTPSPHSYLLLIFVVPPLPLFLPHHHHRRLSSSLKKLGTKGGGGGNDTTMHQTQYSSTSKDDVVSSPPPQKNPQN